MTDVQTIFAWPDGTWCFKDELHEMHHMSDDFVFDRVPTDIDPNEVEDMYEYIRKEKWKK